MLEQNNVYTTPLLQPIFFNTSTFLQARLGRVERRQHHISNIAGRFIEVETHPIL
jgi:hypothetical protein